MAKKNTKALSGASKDAFLRRTLKDETALTDEVRARLTRRLQETIASLRVRTGADDDDLDDVTAADTSPPAATVAPELPAAAFDPYSPNVIVVIRKIGRESALNQLMAIENVDNLRLLAREQQLSIDPDLAAPDAIRDAIITAAERRIANRKAAAG
jgi:hypothetical protein